MTIQPRMVDLLRGGDSFCRRSRLATPAAIAQRSSGPRGRVPARGAASEYKKAPDRSGANRWRDGRDSNPRPSA